MPQPYPGQQWKHGWIPLTEHTLRIKNHGSKPGPDSKLRQASQAARDASAAMNAAIREKAGRRGTAAAADKDVASIAAAVKTQPPVSERRLGGASAQTDLIQLADGTQLVRKRARPGMDDSQDPASEEATSLVGRALGLDTPAVYRPDDKTVYMRYVPDAVTADEAAAGGNRPPRFANAVSSDQGKLVGLLDLLTNNADRNDGNWMLNNRGDIVPIDHGMSYGEIITPNTRPTMEWVHSDFASHYKNPDTDEPIPNPLTAADVAEVRSRLQQLRPDFRRIGRTHWLDYSLRMLDYLAEHASGTRNLIAKAR